jgi:hopene-associated glycosyltransferase HpnB
MSDTLVAPAFQLNADFTTPKGILKMRPSRIMMTILRIASLVSAILWLVIYFRLRFLKNTIPSLNSKSELPDPPGGWPFISAVVPARNEEREVGPCLSSLAAQDYPGFEIVFVNDQSSDGTLAVAKDALKDCRSCRIVEGAPRPAGSSWVGKNWALMQGVAAAQGDWLLFIDSDVAHHPLTFRKAMAESLRLNIDALSILPTIHGKSFWEKCVMPLFATLSVLIEPLDGASHPERRAARLCGAFILIRKDVYQAAGTHEAVRDQILEDMALARILKQQGRRIWLTYTHDLTSTRMYDSFRELWHGLSRLGFPLLRYSIARLTIAWLAAIVGALVPWIATAVGFCLFDGPLSIAGIALCIFNRGAIQPVFTVVRVRSQYAWLLPLAAILYCLAATRAAARHFTGKGLAWKQRVYGTGAQGP